MAFLGLFRKNDSLLGLERLEKLHSELEKLKNTIENIQLEQTRQRSNYQAWLEEKETYIKQLRDRIEKKIDYANKKSEVAPLKKQIQEAVHKKIMRQLGIKPHGEETHQEDVHNPLP